MNNEIFLSLLNWLYIIKRKFKCFCEVKNMYYFIRGFATHEIYRGYSNFLLNMAFISPSEVENIYIS